ncbi:MAG: hypothetical protein CM15mP21_4470 [Hyphomicrobiales bacterium]|nr:MAG: hypothetical protein CM15mP21_4470 [Hyphomicrobiales bacterium]
MNFDLLFLYQRCNCVDGKKISLRAEAAYYTLNGWRYI